MKISNTIGCLLLLFAFLAQGKQVINTSVSNIQPDQSAQYQLDSLGTTTASYAISVSNLTVPFPIYYYLTHKYHFDTYKKHLFFAFKERSLISPYVRNVFYVFISINAP